MAAPGAIAKRTERRQIEILEAIKVLKAEIAELKIGPDRTDETVETIDRTDEILAAINNAAARIGKETERCLNAIGLVANEMISLKAELKPDTPPSPASRRPKK